ncbi:MAG TPA: DUF4124 domain-containing protein [Steroidobacteraceae bacterium]|jgi:hypothetical protein
MNHRHPLFVLSLLACLTAGGLSKALAADDSSGGTKVYRWTDDKGVVHYGDSVPPEYSQKERAVLNSRGVEVGHVEGGLNAAQQAAAQQQASEAQQRAQHDQFLLATYLSTKDIEQLRDERTGLVESQIKAGMAYVDTLNARLGALQERALKFKPYNSDAAARRMPDDLAEELVHTLNESRSQHRQLDAKRHEETDLQNQFNSDIQRYRELTTNRQAH